MQEKLIFLFTFLCFCLSTAFAEPQVNVADLAKDQKAVAVYDETHVTSRCDSQLDRKHARSSTYKLQKMDRGLRRQREDTSRQLTWMDGCIVGYEGGMPIYQPACVLALKESEEEQRERTTDAIHNGANLLAPAILLFKTLGGL